MARITFPSAIPMDTKTKADIHYFNRLLEFDTFDQDSVKSFLISIREMKGLSLWLRELGDFIAHSSRFKGKAIKHYSLFSIKKDGGRTSIFIPVPKKAEELIDDLHPVFEAVDLGIQNLEKRKNGLVFCIMCLLEGSILKFKEGRTGQIRLSSKHSRDKGNESSLDLVILTQGLVLLFMSSNFRASEFIDSEIIDPQEDAICYRALRHDGKLTLANLIFKNSTRFKQITEG